MPRYLMIFLIFLIAITCLPAQQNQSLTFSGYFEPQWFFLWTNEPEQMISSKLRLNGEKKLTPSIYFYANVNFITYHGKIHWDWTSFIPPSVISAIAPENLQYWQFYYQDQILLDNAYLQLFPGKWRITIGKQQLTFGSGYVWNPTDIFNRKDLNDPTYEQPGQNALRLDYNHGTNSRITLVFQPHEKFEHTTVFVRGKTTWKHFDIAVVGALTPWEKNIGTPAGWEKILTGSRLVGLDLNGEVKGIGIYTEGAFRFRDNDRDYMEWLAGLDYTFDNGMMIMIEYYRNTLLPSSSSRLSPDDWFSYLSGEYKTLLRDQIFTMLVISPFPSSVLSLSQIFDFHGRSMAFFPSLEYTIHDDLILTLIGQWLTGTGTDVFHQRFGKGGILRLRFYF